MAEEKMTAQDEQIELLSFDPIVAVLDVLRRWYLIAAVALIAALGVYTASELTYEPQYTTETTFVVSMQESSASVFQNLSATSNLATMFSEVLNSSLLRKTVNEALAPERFTGHIDAAAIAETNLLTMRVTASDPRIAFLATQAVIEHHQEVSRQVMGDIVLEVLQQPRVPAAPSNPMRALGNAKRAALYSALGMCVLLAAVSVMRDTVRSAQEARRKLDCRVLAEIRHERKYRTLRARLRHKKTSILITNPLTSFSYTETIRTLRRKIEQHMPDGGRTVLVTSVLENEGKSTVAVNLALSLAQKRRRVLLLDCDLRKPACCKILGLSWTGSGTADAARGVTEAQKTVQPYGEGRSLDLLLEGRAVRGSAEITGSEGMAALIAWAKANYDVVILDTPPMSAGPDAECLAELADAAVLIVRQNQTEAKRLNAALDALHATRAKVLGCVLNDCRESVLSEQGNYHYGYGYGNYGKYGKYGRYGRYGAYGAQKNEE